MSEPSIEHFLYRIILTLVVTVIVVTYMPSSLGSMFCVCDRPSFPDVPSNFNMLFLPGPRPSSECSHINKSSNSTRVIVSSDLPDYGQQWLCRKRFFFSFQVSSRSSCREKGVLNPIKKGKKERSLLHETPDLWGALKKKAGVVIQSLFIYIAQRCWFLVEQIY